MGGIRIEGSSGNVADATSAGNLKVQLSNTAAQVGSVRMMSEVDDGSITGSPQLKSPETSIDYRMRVGIDSLLDHYTFTQGTFNASKFHTEVSQGNIGYGQTYGYSLRINTSTNASANVTGRIMTRRAFHVYSQNVPLYCETSWSISAAVVGSTVYEVGLFGAISNTYGIPDDGAGFRINSSGIYGFVVRNGTETNTGVLLALTPGTSYNATVVLGTGEVQFFLNDVAYSLPIKTTSSDTVKWTSLSWCARLYQSAAVASSQYMTVWQYSIMQGDVPIAMPQSHNAVLMNGHIEPLPWINNNTGSYTLDTAPATYTLGTTLNGLPYGHIQYPAAITAAETDRPVWTWSLATNAQDSRRFVMTGIRICEAMVTGAVTGGPLFLQWSLMHSYTGTTDTDTSTNPVTSQGRVAPRYVMLGSQVITANAAAGYLSSPVDVEFGNSPIIFQTGWTSIYNRLQCRFLGTSTTAGTIRQAFQIRGYWI